jgi:hypothetical protein
LNQKGEFDKFMKIWFPYLKILGQDIAAVGSIRHAVAEMSSLTIVWILIYMYKGWLKCVGEWEVVYED